MQPQFLDYDLPPDLIAQHPAPVRDQSRLLLVDRGRAALGHHQFCDLPSFLAAGDLLVLNDSRVLPARLLGRRERTGGRWEGLFLGQAKDGAWEMLCQTRGRLAEGEVILFDAPDFRLELLNKTPAGHWLARPTTPGTPVELLERHGHMPLPPYIRKGRAQADDRERYQTVFAETAGSVAAPTAGLHFTQELLDRLRARGVELARVTLHVGLGTFQPIRTSDYTRHRMHREWAHLPAATVAAIAACRARGGRVIAVGTTTVRVLETVAAGGPLHPWTGETELFIYPPFEFRVVDALITNFHLPHSTLLLLVGAFAGVALLREAYMTAMAGKYRFYSYGDAMLIV